MADGLHNQIATALANTALTVVGGTASISTMRYSSPGPSSNLPPAPVTVIGPPSGRLSAASWEVLDIRFPMRVYSAKLRSASQTQHDVNEWIDGFLTTYRSGITLALSSLGVMEAIIESWNSDAFYEINGEPYQAIDFVVLVQVARAETYTA